MESKDIYLDLLDHLELPSVASCAGRFIEMQRDKLKRIATQEEVKETLASSSGRAIAMKNIRQTLGMDVLKRDEGGE